MKRFEKGDKIEGFRKCHKIASAEAVRIDEPFAVVTRKGTMIGNAGDYLMRGIEGELYPCDALIFERSYKWAEPAPKPKQTPEDHLRSIQAMFVEFGMREPELRCPVEGESSPDTAKLVVHVDNSSYYHITCFELLCGGLHTFVTHSVDGTLFEGYSRVRSFAAVQNHLAKHSMAVQRALGVPTMDMDDPDRDFGGKKS